MMSLGLSGRRSQSQMAPISNEDLLLLDAADNRTKRGAKMEKDKNSARS